MYLLQNFVCLEIYSSIKTDSSSLAQYICRSFRVLYGSVWDKKIRTPPAEASVGVCPILYPGISVLLVREFFCESLLLLMHIVLKLASRRLRKVTRSLMCEDNNDIFKCNNEKPCCFSFQFFWIHGFQSSHSSHSGISSVHAGLSQELGSTLSFL